MKRSTRIIELFCVCAIVALSGIEQVHGGLIDSNDLSLTSYQSADGKNITTDTQTGLDWLDISTTKGISVTQMSGLLGVGQLKDFRYATLDEINVFFNNLGLPTKPLSAGIEDTADPAFALYAAAASHTGVTNDGTFFGQFYAAGFYGSGLEALYQKLEIEGDDTLRTRQITVSFEVHATIGNWIVRAPNPVPEPSSLVMLGMAAIGLVGFRRRKRKPVA